MALRDNRPKASSEAFLPSGGLGGVTPQVLVTCYVGRFIPISNAQWKFPISRSCLSLSIRLSHGSSPNSELFDREKQPILELVKTFISRNECRLKNHSRIINLIWSSFNQTLDGCYLIWARVWFLDLQFMSDYFNPSPYSQTEYSISHLLIKFIWLGQISHVRTELKTPYWQRF